MVNVTQRVEVGFDQRARRQIDALTRAVEENTRVAKAQESPSTDVDLHHDEQTLIKFDAALRESGLTGNLIRETVINNVLNAGLLIRERK